MTLSRFVLTQLPCEKQNSIKEKKRTIWVLEGDKVKYVAKMNTFKPLGIELDKAYVVKDIIKTNWYTFCNSLKLEQNCLTGLTLL